MLQLARVLVPDKLDHLRRLGKYRKYSLLLLFTSHFVGLMHCISLFFWPKPVSFTQGQWARNCFRWKEKEEKVKQTQLQTSRPPNIIIIIMRFYAPSFLPPSFSFKGPSLPSRRSKCIERRRSCLCLCWKCNPVSNEYLPDLIRSGTRRLTESRVTTEHSDQPSLAVCKSRNRRRHHFIQECKWWVVCSGGSSP
jgi:hypothetical protein